MMSVGDTVFSVYEPEANNTFIALIQFLCRLLITGITDDCSKPEPDKLMLWYCCRPVSFFVHITAVPGTISNNFVASACWIYEDAGIWTAHSFASYTYILSHDVG